MDFGAKIAFFGERIVAATFQPRSAKSSAVALPMPLEAPVIRTVLLQDHRRPLPASAVKLSELMSRKR